MSDTLNSLTPAPLPKGEGRFEMQVNANHLHNDQLEQAVEPFRLTDRLSDSERAMLMGGACAKASGWLPMKS